MKLLSQNSLRSFFFACSLVITAPAIAEESAEITWTPSFDTAATVAKQEKKPIFLYFTGSDWCSWCQKMDSEILSSPDFVKAVGPKFVFYAADFPVYKTLDKDIAAKNDELKKRYNIVGFPTVVLLTPDLHEFGKLNYREGGGKMYAEHLLKLLDEHANFENGLKNIKKENLQSLQAMYERANRLGLDEARDTILKEGCSRGDIAFFMKERYAELLAQDKIASDEAKHLRARILALDPSNKRRLHYDIAIMDFEASSKDLATQPNASRAIKPLEDYLATYGNKDLKTRWKIEMIIAQTLTSKSELDAALKYAQAAEQHAPPRHKPSCSEVVAAIQNQPSTANFIADER